MESNASRKAAIAYLEREKYKDSVDSIMHRMKLVLGVETDSEFARSIDEAQSTVSNWRQRNSIPLKPLLKFAGLHNLSLDYLIFGLRKPTIPVVEWYPVENTPRYKEANLLLTVEYRESSGDLVRTIMAGRYREYGPLRGCVAPREIPRIHRNFRVLAWTYAPEIYLQKASTTSRELNAPGAVE